MENKYSRTIDDLFDMFSDALSPADVMASKLIAQISSAITAERLKLKMNQSEFAEYIEASQSLVSRWEHGEYNFSLKKLAEIAVKLNLDVNISINKNTSEESSLSILDSGKKSTKIIAFRPKQEPVSKFKFYRELEEM